jgi:ADP-ribose pyrophosphatase
MAKRATSDDLKDSPSAVEVSAPTTIARSFFEFQRYHVTLRSHDGKPVEHGRDFLRIGRTVGVLPYDPARDEIILFRQFRLGAHVANGRSEMVEIVAGLVDGGEDLAAAAMRECEEEIGLAPARLIRFMSFLPAPGFLDEYATLFLGLIDAAQVPDRAGVDAEGESMRPLRVSVDDALAAVAAGTIENGYTLHALHWLALNRHRLAAILAAEAARDDSVKGA